MGINKRKLHNDLIELVGIKFHCLDEMLGNGKNITEFNIKGWKDKYLGHQSNHPHEIVINKFNPEVNQFVAMIEKTIDSAEVK